MVEERKTQKSCYLFVVGHGGHEFESKTLTQNRHFMSAILHLTH